MYHQSLPNLLSSGRSVRAQNWPNLKNLNCSTPFFAMAPIGQYFGETTHEIQFFDNPRQYMFHPTAPNLVRGLCSKVAQFRRTVCERRSLNLTKIGYVKRASKLIFGRAMFVKGSIQTHELHLYRSHYVTPNWVTQ